FLVFNQMSEQLVDSYHQLQQRVARLGEELAAARGERMVELAEKERLANRLSKLLDGLPAAVLLVDGAERIQQYNPAALQLFPGISAGECWERLLGGAVRADPLGKELRLENGRLVNLIPAFAHPRAGAHPAVDRYHRDPGAGAAHGASGAAQRAGRDGGAAGPSDQDPAQLGAALYIAPGAGGSQPRPAGAFLRPLPRAPAAHGAADQ
ncbi:MAG: PAS domain-containing protein, partial [gamma proteobacterium symbiont of Phacoides pectinatus]